MSKPELSDEEKAANLYRFIMDSLVPEIRKNTLQGMTVPMLRRMAKASGKSFTTRTRKAELVALLLSDKS